MQMMFENSGLYTAIELGKAQFSPIRMLIKANKEWHSSHYNPFAHTHWGRSLAAGYELAERMTRHYPKPQFGIRHVDIEGKRYDIQEEVVVSKDFCHLIHFKKKQSIQQPKLLIVAPMSGHHATLLRGTVEDALVHFDVYITDWLDARDVPLSRGNFDLDDFIDYCIGFIEFIGKGVHVLAVCQPAVPVLAAVSIMSHEARPILPASMILIGGPIDTRKNPTEVDLFAERRTIQWFESHVITRVPFQYPGFLRPVYPGFIQLMGFMAMNMQRHVGEHMKLFQHLVVGDGESAAQHRKFYNEYLSVMDLPGQFYLQTVQTVFKDYALPRGIMKSRGRPVVTEAINHTALLAIEGELDDISGVGQTKAACDICTNIPAEKKHYHLQQGVGHYGVFNGRKFREDILPIIVEFCLKNKDL
jgi:poly(3-hydroxybutyrate) depolymerase